MQIAPSESITTVRCCLRYPSEDDLQYIWSASRYKGFNDGMVWEPPSSMVELQENLQRTHEAWSEGTAFTWTVDAKEDARFIGRIALRQTDQLREWSLGYWIHPTEQGCGFASEVAAAVIDIGFERLQASCITAAHATRNEASGKVLQRAGMKRTGFTPQGFKKRGEWVEEYEYQIDLIDRKQ